MKAGKNLKIRAGRAFSRSDGFKRGRFVNAVAVMAMLVVSSASSTTISYAGEDQPLAKLETKFFEHTYNKDATADRLTRLEKLVFGESRTGSDAERLANLVQASSQNQEAGDPGSGQNTAAGSANPGSSSPTNKPSTNTADAEEPAAPPQKQQPAAVGSYPRVTRLEKSLLGKSYETDGVESRLERLETKAFGAPTTIQDMSERTDRIESYVASKNPGGGSGGDSNDPSWEPSVAPKYSYQQQAPTPFSSSKPAQGGRQSMPMDQLVASMEQKVFGRAEPTQSLTKRVAQLEKNVFPDQKDRTDVSLADRVAGLAGALQMTGTQPAFGTPFAGRAASSKFAGSAGGYPQQPSGSYSQAPQQSYQSQQNYGSTYPQEQQQSYSQGSTPGDYEAQQQPALQPYTSDVAQDPNANPQKQQKHGSFLGGLAKALVGVGSMAGSAMGSMGGMGYGMGGMGGMGYGGYGGMGGYGSPYGGYGASPYGMGGMGGMGGLYNMNRMPFGGMGGLGMPSYGSGFGGMGSGYRVYP